MEFNIESEKELEKITDELQKSLFMKAALESRTGKEYGAIVIGLFGDLGSGKTTFTKYFAEQFGLKAKDVISPTFVIQKRFDISEEDESIHPFKNLYHLDVYRIEDPREIESIGWREITADPQNIILVEWADKIKNLLPEDTIKMFFKSTGENSRNIKIEIS